MAGMFSAFPRNMILSPKHLPRLVSTIRLFTNYGLGDFANRQGLLGLEGARLDGDEAVQGDLAAKAKAFRLRLVELGPAYIKLGQVLSTRPDLLPKPYIEELEHLQDDVSPMPFEQVERTIEEELHARISKLFASFDPEIESLEDFMGPTILGYFDRLFNGRQLKILGYNRQRIPGNWKLMQENIKDPYHPGLLHTWFVTFGLWRADNKSKLLMDDRHRHAAMVSTRGASGKSDQVTQVSSFKDSMQLNDPSFLDIVPEPWWEGPTAVMTTIFPSVIFQQQVNSVSTRHIQPDGHGAFDFVWTHFGFEDDSEDMTQRRLRQANLFGPAGFVSADDGEVIEWSQQGFESKPFHRTMAELGGREVGDTDHMVTETLIRGMYEYWRKLMEA